MVARDVNIALLNVMGALSAFAIGYALARFVTWWTRKPRAKPFPTLEDPGDLKWYQSVTVNLVWLLGAALCLRLAAFAVTGQ